MSNSKVYLLLYYIGFMLTITVLFLCSTTVNTFAFLSSDSFLSWVIGSIFFDSFVSFVFIINIILVIVFSVLLIKKKLDKINVLFPIIYIVFLLLVLLICFLFNNKLIIPYIHFTYYFLFILVNYILLNTYSILSLKKK